MTPMVALSWLVVVLLAKMPRADYLSRRTGSEREYSAESALIRRWIRDRFRRVARRILVCEAL